MFAQIEVKMILMMTISFWAQNGCEVLARASVYFPQEQALCTLSLPTTSDTDLLAIGQSEDTDVECGAIAML